MQKIQIRFPDPHFCRECNLWLSTCVHGSRDTGFMSVCDSDPFMDRTYTVPHTKIFVPVLPLITLDSIYGTLRMITSLCKNRHFVLFVSPSWVWEYKVYIVDIYVFLEWIELSRCFRGTGLVRQYNIDVFLNCNRDCWEEMLPTSRCKDLILAGTCSGVHSRKACLDS